ncbi:39S ribosomal protein L16, mitochondrial [Dimargaris xerosporica]|nr:39S ribosomal protein L16, mitochondrial [Dimargaris xerosporica]
MLSLNRSLLQRLGSVWPRSAGSAKIVAGHLTPQTPLGARSLSLAATRTWNSASGTPSLLLASRSPLTTALAWAVLRTSLNTAQKRTNTTLQPRKPRSRKAHKGRIPVRTGGSQKGTFMAFGDYGLRIKHGARLTARQLETILADLKRRLKEFKGSQIWLRVYPTIPVTSKGNEVRMGKGKGDLEYWCCRVPKDKIVFEIAGPGLRPEIAKTILQSIRYKMPVKTAIIYRAEEEAKLAALSATTEAQA